MSKYPTQHHKLSKRDQKKHFASELGLGKTDLPRQFTKAGNDAYKGNKFFDNCEFEQKKRARLEALG